MTALSLLVQECDALAMVCSLFFLVSWTRNDWRAMVFYPGALSSVIGGPLETETSRIYGYPQYRAYLTPFRSLLQTPGTRRLAGKLETSQY